MGFALTIVVMVVVLGLCWRYLGAYMVAVYEGRSRWLRWLGTPCSGWCWDGKAWIVPVD